MPRRPQVSVEPRPDGRWAVQTDGTQRADSLHDRKPEAVRRAREPMPNSALLLRGVREGYEPEVHTSCRSARSATAALRSAQSEVTPW